MDYLRIVQYETSQIDEMRRVADEWEAAAADDQRIVQRVMLCRDRENAGQYFTVAFFDSVEAAAAHSNLPATQEYGRRMMAFADAPPSVYNLDVLDDRA